MSTNATLPHRRGIPPLTPSEEERLRLARERAQAYRTRRTPDAPVELPRDYADRDENRDETIEQTIEEEIPQTLDEWQDVVSRRVDDAMRRGLFDNLPGQGKPQPIQRDPFVPEDRQMAYNLMKKNEIAPGWIVDRKSLLGAIDVLRADIRAVALTFWAKTEQTPTGPAREHLTHQWQGYLATWEERVDTLNHHILNLNLSQPFHFLEVYKLRLDEELRRAGVTRNLPDSQDATHA